MGIVLSVVYIVEVSLNHFRHVIVMTKEHDLRLSLNSEVRDFVLLVIDLHESQVLDVFELLCKAVKHLLGIVAEYTAGLAVDQNYVVSFIRVLERVLDNSAAIGLHHSAGLVGGRNVIIISLRLLARMELFITAIIYMIVEI